MSRAVRTLAVVSALASATALTACQDTTPSGGGASAPPPPHTSGTPSQATGSGAPSSTPTSSGVQVRSPLTAGDVGPDGADASRREALSIDGGYVAQGSRITFVYRTGLRYTVDVGRPVPTTDGTRTTPKGVLILRSGSATFTDRNGVTTVNAQGAGTVADGAGAIVVTPDGSTTCLSSRGIQFVGVDGQRGAADRSGALYTDKSGQKLTLGQAPNVTDLAGRYTVCNVGRTASVELYSDVLFAFDSDRLTPAGKAVSAGAANSIRKDVSGKAVTLVGHTDSKGSMAYNQGLGLRRANAVAAELRAKIPGVNVAVRSAGETEPVAANVTADGKDNPAGRAKNRRTTISWAR